MIISYFGEQFFKISQGDLVVAYNPIGKEAKVPVPTRFGANVALISLNDPRFSGVESVTHGDTVPFVINGAGEYEVKGIDIVGVSSVTMLGKEEKINTSYIITIDDMKLCLLGGLSNEKSVTDIKAKAGDIDILFLPVGEFMNPSDAQKVAVLLEPSIVLPMSYDKDSLAKFLKENESYEKVDKLTIRKKDLAGKEGEVVVLEY